MELHQLQQQIVNNNLDKMYIFTGEESGIMDIYIHQICSTGNFRPVRVDKVQQAYSMMVQGGLNSRQSRCFIVRDDKDYLKDEKVWPVVKQAAQESNSMLIVLYTNIDKRSKFWKDSKKEIVVFEKLSPQMIAKYIQREIEMTSTFALQLAEMCDSDYNRAMLESEKVKLYYDAGYAKNYDDSFIQLREQGVIHQPIGDITFKFTDSIATRDYAKTAEYLLQAKAKNEPEIMVLSILYNTFKQILMVQGLGRDQTNAVQRTGLTSWQVNMARNKQGHYTIGELVNALRTIRQIEKDIKTGQLDVKDSLDYLIVNIM